MQQNHDREVEGVEELISSLFYTPKAVAFSNGVLYFSGAHKDIQKIEGECFQWVDMAEFSAFLSCKELMNPLVDVEPADTITHLLSCGVKIWEKLVADFICPCAFISRAVFLVIFCVIVYFLRIWVRRFTNTAFVILPPICVHAACARVCVCELECAVMHPPMYLIGEWHNSPIQINQMSWKLSHNKVFPNQKLSGMIIIITEFILNWKSVRK